VNASLLQEVMEHNPFTTVFLNDTRPRSGKFNEQVRPDIMIKLLLKCFTEMAKLKYEVLIVPVSINSDRTFDSGYLADDMINGSLQPGTTLLNVLYKVWSMRKGTLGKIFVNYGEPLSLN
jgi:glycerol-3-phosphate O-acyltransferase